MILTPFPEVISDYAQVIIGSSSSSTSFPPLDLPINSAPPPTRQTARFWPSLPPRGRSDVPIRATVRNKTSTTPQTETRATLSPVVTQATRQTTVLTGELTANTPPSDRVPSKQDSVAVQSAATGSTDKQPQASRLPVTAQSQKSSQSDNTPPQVTTTATTSVVTTKQEAVRTSSKASNQPNKTAQLGRNTASTTVHSSRTGITSFLTGVVPATDSHGYAAVALLALRVAGVSVLQLQLGVLLVAGGGAAVYPLLLAADLLSQPCPWCLSPCRSPTMLGPGYLSGFLCYVFPASCPPIPIPGPEEARRKAWTGSRRTGVILARVLAGTGRTSTGDGGWFTSGPGSWSWLGGSPSCFWVLGCSGGLKVAGEVRREDQMAEQQETCHPPANPVGSTQRHTCWSKIVQSLRGKPCRKSDSNGVGGGGGGGGPGEMPNNWAGQERSGVDISKSLIRNQNHEQATAQPRCVKDSNRGRNYRGHSAERGISDGSTGSLLRLQALGRPPQRSVSGSLDQERDTSLSLYEFDLRPPSPIDLTRSIDEALHREHLLGGGSLFHPLNQTSQSPSPGSGVSQGPWLRRNSDPQLLSESSEAPTESSMPLGGSILSSVPSRQVTAPPTPSHQGHRWAGNGAGSVPSSVSCPVSLRPSRTSTGHLGEDGVDDTRPFITPDSERVRGRAGRPVGSRSYLEVSRHDDSASVSSEIIDL
ncbi:proline-rich transmembrane protein 3 [Lates japonicus]|uniref:Proline-rich transmembrane protein 3 n=1 Tax=Lates japonicus TaxID=270547 RepID=A0AAD3M2D0_LATJO|nr:proline-rich transmembrane protein 3 [Lates japonicus]